MPSLTYRIQRKFNYLFNNKAFQRMLALSSMENYNMNEEPNEVFYKKLYLHWLQLEIQQRGLHPGNSVLDLGCGQGRLSIPLAQQGYQCLGIDLSADAIQYAKNQTQNFTHQPHFRCQDFETFFKHNRHKFSVIMAIESLLYYPNAKAYIKQMCEHLEKQGLMVLSLRTKLFNTAHCVLNDNIPNALNVAQSDHGTFYKAQFSWHTYSETKRFLETLGLTNIRAYGIGLVSGIEGDPQSFWASPANINTQRQEQLFQTELRLSPEYPDSGRYMLIFAQRGS